MNKKKSIGKALIALALVVCLLIIFAAVLYTMTTGRLVPPTPPPRVDLSEDRNGANWTVIMTGFTYEIYLRDVMAVLTDEDGYGIALLEDLTEQTDNGTIGDAKWILSFCMGVESTDKLSASQAFIVNGYHANSADGTCNYARGYKLKLIFIPTGDLVASVILD